MGQQQMGGSSSGKGSGGKSGGAQPSMGSPNTNMDNRLTAPEPMGGPMPEATAMPTAVGQQQRQGFTPQQSSGGGKGFGDTVGKMNQPAMPQSSQQSSGVSGAGSMQAAPQPISGGGKSAGAVGQPSGGIGGQRLDAPQVMKAQNEAFLQTLENQVRPQQNIPQQGMPQTGLVNTPAKPIGASGQQLSPLDNLRNRNSR